MLNLNFKDSTIITIVNCDSDKKVYKNYYKKQITKAMDNSIFVLNLIFKDGRIITIVNGESDKKVCKNYLKKQTTEAIDNSIFTIIFIFKMARYVRLLTMTVIRRFARIIVVL